MHIANAKRIALQSRTTMQSKLIVATALSSIAATAHAGFLSVLPEPATVTLIFVALAAVGLAVFRKRPAPAEDASES